MKSLSSLAAAAASASSPLMTGDRLRIYNLSLCVMIVATLQFYLTLDRRVVSTLTVITPKPNISSRFASSSFSSTLSNVSLHSSSSSSSSLSFPVTAKKTIEFTANDEEIPYPDQASIFDGVSTETGYASRSESGSESGASIDQPIHVVDRQSWLHFASHQPSSASQTSSSSSSQLFSPSSSSSNNSAERNLTNSLIDLALTSSYRTGQNCSYVYGDIFCDCDPNVRRFSCYNVASVDDVRRAFDHLLNATRLVYWSQLEIHCVEPPITGDDSLDKATDSMTSSSSSSSASSSSSSASSSVAQTFHISAEMFTDGPKFESILFVGDCSKPKHYDNLITVDREVHRIVMINNMLRMATSCSLLQPKFERLNELTLRDSLVAGDMISSTFSTRCLGQYGTRNEPMQLTKLVITACNISLIESGAFHNFAELETIDLSANRITHLSRQTFAPHLYRLRTLRLQRNRLSTISGEFFEKLPELREVDLSQNRLTTLPPLPSAGPGVAQVVRLAANPWDCRCRLTWTLDEPLDSVRLIADDPVCMTPAIVKNYTLFVGLQLVRDTFC